FVLLDVPLYQVSQDSCHGQTPAVALDELLEAVERVVRDPNPGRSRVPAVPQTRAAHRSCRHAEIVSKTNFAGRPAGGPSTWRFSGLPHGAEDHLRGPDLPLRHPLAGAADVIHVVAAGVDPDVVRPRAGHEEHQVARPRVLARDRLDPRAVLLRVRVVRKSLPHGAVHDVLHQPRAVEPRRPGGAVAVPLADMSLDLLEDRKSTRL